MSTVPREEQASLLAAAARGLSENQYTGAREVEVLRRKPNWTELESQGQVPVGGARVLDGMQALHGEVYKIRTYLEREMGAVHLALGVVGSGSPELSRYVLTLLYELCREDGAAWDTLVKVRVVIQLSFIYL
jgi:hypothetical protein